MSAVDGLFLDLDLTLLDNSRFADSLLQTCHRIARRRPELDANRLFEANGRIWRAYWTEIVNDWTLGKLAGIEVNREAWRQTLEACGCEEQSVTRFALETHMELELQSYRLFDDVPALVEAVKEARIPIALITNGASDTQRRKLDALGIESWFDVIVISGEVGAAKPDPFVFDPALERLGVDPGNVWHVGDSLDSDVAGARAAGVNTAWLNRDGQVRKDSDPAPHVEICTLRQLLNELRI